MMVILSTKQVILLAAFLTSASLVKCQVWNDPNNGIMVKTFYLPLRKGSSSISLQDINRGRHLTTLNIPYLPVKVHADLQQASTLNQNYHPKIKLHETDVQQLQDLRPKSNTFPHKPEFQGQLSNSHDSFSGSTFQPQQLNVLQQPSANFANQNIAPPHQINQPQFMPNHQNMHHQNVNYHKNFTDIHHHGSGFSNDNFESQNTHSSGVGIPNLHNQINFGQRIYSSNNLIAPAPNNAHTELYDAHNQQGQQNQYHNYPNQEIHQNTQTTFSGESSRFLHQMQSEINPTQPAAYTSPNNQHSSYPQSNYGIQPSNYGGQPSNYGTQIPTENLHVEPVINNNNPYQIQQFQENRHIQTTPNQQLQQPVNTFAVVHQRIPENNYPVQDNRASVPSEQSTFSNFKQFSEAIPASSYASYNHNGPTTSPNYDTSFQIAPQTHLNGELSHNSVENTHYNVKQIANGPFDNHQHNGHKQQYTVDPQRQTAVPHNSVENTHYNMKQVATGPFDNHQYSGHNPHYTVGLQRQTVPHLPQGQHGTSEGQYLNQQQSNYAVVQNHHDSKSRFPQQQNAPPQLPYPDPTSETFYPENKQIYVAPPPDYSSLVAQQPGRENNFGRHPLQGDTNVHNSQSPLSMQTEQVGIHISVPNRNVVLRDSTSWSKYGNTYQ